MFRLAVSTLLGLLAFSSFAAASPDEADTTMDSLNKVEDSLKGLQTKLLSDKSRYDREAEPAVPSSLASLKVKSRALDSPDSDDDDAPQSIDAFEASEDRREKDEEKEIDAEEADDQKESATFDEEMKGFMHKDAAVDDAAAGDADADAPPSSFLERDEKKQSAEGAAYAQLQRTMEGLRQQQAKFRADAAAEFGEGFASRLEKNMAPSSLMQTESTSLDQIRSERQKRVAAFKRAMQERSDRLAKMAAGYGIHLPDYLPEHQRFEPSSLLETSEKIKENDSDGADSDSFLEEDPDATDKAKDADDDGDWAAKESEVQSAIKDEMNDLSHLSKKYAAMSRKEEQFAAEYRNKARVQKQKRVESSFMQKGPYDEVVREAHEMAENTARDMEARTARVSNPYASKLGMRALAHENEIKASAEKLFGGSNMRKAPDE